MDSWATLKPPEAAAEADQSEYRHPSADDPRWERCFDLARGERLLRRDGAGRPAELICADGARLRLSHDEAGNLRTPIYDVCVCCSYYSAKFFDWNWSNFRRRISISFAGNGHRIFELDK